MLLDRAKNLHTVSHHLIEKALPGLSKGCNAWLVFTYLSNGQQWVEGTCVSQLHLISCGVPQASIFGPLLCLILNNDHPGCLQYTTCGGRWHNDMRILPIHCWTTVESPLVATSPQVNSLSSAGDKSLTVRSSLFFLKIVRIERKFHVIDRLCTVRCSFFFSRG